VLLFSLADKPETRSNVKQASTSSIKAFCFFKVSVLCSTQSFHRFDIAHCDSTSVCLVWLAFARFAHESDGKVHPAAR
jgi:hypothetical protein